MNHDILVDAELDRVDWSNLQVASGSAAEVPNSFRQLLAATTAEEIKKAYWKLENRVVVQGHLYEASLYLVPAICAALADPDRSLLVRTWVIELLYQICSGYYAKTDDSSASPPDIADRCRIKAKGALWILYAELMRQEIKVTEDSIKVLRDDPERLAILRKAIPDYSPPVWKVT